MTFKLNIFTVIFVASISITETMTNNANADLLTINVNDASMTIDDFGRISSFIIEGQEQLNESFWYTSVRETGTADPYSAPLRVGADNYNVVQHVASDGAGGWSLEVERKPGALGFSDIQFEYTGTLINDIAGDKTATFSANAFWRNINAGVTGNTDCDCYFFIDPNLSGTPNNDIATMTQDLDGTLRASFVDPIDGVALNFSVQNAVEWEIANSTLLQSKLDNAVTNVALANITSPFGPGDAALAIKGVTLPVGLDADGCGCNIDFNQKAHAVPSPSTAWLLSLGIIGLVARKHIKRSYKQSA